MTRRVIIDTDPGKDDAVAILLALASPELVVEALIAVAGNVPLARTSGNARRLLALAGRSDIPVYGGCGRPMVRTPITAEHVHGETGLPGLDLPDAAVPLRPEHGVDALIDAVRGAPGAITLCLLGPATNLAMALVKAPDIAAFIPEVVWMAGARSEGGNTTPAAEYNVHADPDAAAVVLRSGIPLVLIPLDLTHQIQVTPERLDRLRGIDSPAARAVAALYSGPRGWDGAPLHDPCVIVHLLRPDLMRGRRIHVAVETSSPLTLGMTVADWHGVTGRPANALFLTEADVPGIFELLFDRLA